MPDGGHIHNNNSNDQGPTALPSLTDCGIGDPVATEWVKYLVQAVGHDVMSVRRNTRVSYMVLERARDSVKAINGYIDEVDKSGDRPSFMKYTVAIDPLEEILLKLLLFTEDERDKYFAGTTTIKDCITSITRWETNREELSKALEGFNTRDELSGLFNDTKPGEDERREAQINDDKALLKEMRDSISTSKDSIGASSLQYITTAATSLNTLQDNVISASRAGWWMDTTIRTSMLVGSVLKMVGAASLDTATRNHLKSKSVWDAAAELIDALTTKDEILVGKKYEAFLLVLGQTSELKLPSYIELLKAAGKIRRPFQAQAFALTNLCCDLADQFAKPEKKAVVTVENVDDLQAAYKKALGVLQEAANAALKLKSFNLAQFDANATVQAFKTAHGLIEKIFKSPDLNLESVWTAKQEDLNKAFKRDESRMNELNAKFEKSSSSTPAEKITIKVSISDKLQGGTELSNVSVEEEISTRLLALRWNVAGTPKLTEGQTKRARDVGTFYKMTAGASDQPLELHSTLAEIAGSDRNTTLKLVIAEVP